MNILINLRAVLLQIIPELLNILYLFSINQPIKIRIFKFQQFTLGLPVF